MRPKDRKYLQSHEWALADGDTVTIGISDHAISHLSDLVFLDLPAVGTELQAGDSFGEIESVKAVSDLYSPVSGEVIEVNEALPEDLDQLVVDPFGAGWMLKVRATNESPNLMDAATYDKHLEAEGD